jgi:hypothetical protein
VIGSAEGGGLEALMKAKEPRFIQPQL